MNNLVNHESVIEYFTMLKWIRKKSNYSNVDFFIYPDDTSISIPIPTKKLEKGYNVFISEAINILSDVYEMSPDAVTLAISSLDWDVYRYRLLKIDNHNEEDVPFLLISTFLDSIFEFIGDAAFAVFAENTKREQEHREKKKNKVKKITASEFSDEFLNCSRFTHTWRGSFGISIKTPLLLPSIELIPGNSIPLGREVTNYIDKITEIVNQSVNEKSYQFIQEKITERYEVKTTKNLLELQKLFDRDRNEQINLSILYSPQISTKNSLKELLFLNYEVVTNIERALGSLSIEETEKEITLIGFPETMHATIEDLLQESLLEDVGIISVNGFSKELGGKCNLRFNLKKDLYKIAVYCHQHQKNIFMRCKVSKRLRGWKVLGEVLEFKQDKNVK